MRRFVAETKRVGFRQALREHFGRRGGILTLFGFVWILLGFSFAFVDVARFSRPGPGGVLEFMDSLPIPGLFWVLCGVIALVNGIIRRRIDNEDAWGYSALIMPPTLWGLTYAWSFGLWVFTHNSANPDERFGRESSFIGIMVFAIMVVVIRTIANWPDDMDVEHVIKHKNGSGELAMLDRMTETKDENDQRGNRARDESERWIQQARIETEMNIAASADENDRMIRSVQEEEEIGRRNEERRDAE